MSYHLQYPRIVLKDSLIDSLVLILSFKYHFLWFLRGYHYYRFGIFDLCLDFPSFDSNGLVQLQDIQ